MAENVDKDSKTEDATERRVQDAIEKGNVPYSREAGIFASLAAVFVALSYFVGTNVANLRDAMMRLIDNPGGFSLESGADAVNLFALLGMESAGVLLPFVLVIMLAGLASTFFQNAPQLVLDRITPHFNRISLGGGIKRIYGAQGRVEFLKSMFKLAAVCVLGYFILKGAQADLINSMFMEPSALPALIHGLAARLFAWMAVATLLLVAADLVWSRIFWRQELKMSRQEIKDEFKQAEGDPIVKARMRSLARDRVRKRMMANVPRATMVIVNPTHYAVALRYVREEGGAPLVVAKGQDLIALKIRGIAEENSIPIVEDKVLARSLYQSVEIDQMIPPEFYRVVAELVFFLGSRKGTLLVKR